jgi:Spy/CpxP family protein refolding chaperone
MMKNSIITFLFALCSLQSIAQNDKPKEQENNSREQRNTAREQITSAKIGLITTRLNLTTEQAPQFWAIYNEYSDKKFTIRQDLRKTRVTNTSLTSTDAQVQESLNQMLAIRQKEVDLEKEYMNKFLKTISPRQLAELYKTEQDFTKLLLERLEYRRGPERHENNERQNRD